MQLPDDQDVAESTGIRDGAAGRCRSGIGGHDDGCLARHAGLGRDCGGDVGSSRPICSARSPRRTPLIVTANGSGQRSISAETFAFSP